MKGQVQPKLSPTTALVVDDEEHVRARITDLLGSFSTVKVIGECSNGLQAVEMIGTLRPELVFLDIQMPLLDGFDVVHALDPSVVPVVVFITAFDEHAIRAFDVNAVDYVLKPIDEARFAKAVARSVQRVCNKRSNQDASVTDATTVSDQLQRPCKRLLVKKQDSHLVIKTQDIEWIEAADKYVRLHTNDAIFTSRQTMKELESKLDGNEFMRIHRSVIVNLSEIKEIQPHFHGEFRIIISNGTALPLGRSYRQAFNARFQSGL